MDKVSIVKHQFRMEEWRKRIAECQASGMAVSHWCKQNFSGKPSSDNDIQLMVCSIRE